MSHFLDFTPWLNDTQGLSALTHFIPALKDGAFVLRNGKIEGAEPMTTRPLQGQNGLTRPLPPRQGLAPRDDLLCGAAENRTRVQKESSDTFVHVHSSGIPQS